MEHALNNRIIELAKAIEVPEPHRFGRLLGLARTDTVQNVFKHISLASTNILVLIADKVVSKTGEKVNVHWLVTGEGPMFIGHDHPESYKSDNKIAEKDVDALSSFVLRLEQRVYYLEERLRTVNPA